MRIALSSVIEERRSQGAKGQTMGKLFLAGFLVPNNPDCYANHPGRDCQMQARFE